MASRSKKTEPGLETALAELQQIVDRMESGELSLEESLKAFEQGIHLTRLCQEKLTSAEQRVQLLMQKQGEIYTEPFADSDDDSADLLDEDEDE